MTSMEDWINALAVSIIPQHARTPSTPYARYPPPLLPPPLYAQLPIIPAPTSLSERIGPSIKEYCHADTHLPLSISGLTTFEGSFFTPAK